MKQSNLAMKIMVSVLMVGVLAYLGFSIFRDWREPVMTTLAYETSVNVGASANAILVREERVITGGGGGFVDLAPSEGERVAAGDTVAVIYQNESGMETRHAIRLLSAELEQLSYALTSGAEDVDTSKLDEAVLQSIVNLRALSSTGDLSGLEESALNLRTMVFKRDYTYGGAGAAQSAAQLIQEKEQELAGLQASLNRVATTISAPVSGIFSGEADGYEELINPESVQTLTPTELTELMRRDVLPPGGAVGKLITSATWYLAVVLDEEQSKGLTVGKSYVVAFSHDWYGTVDMTLERVGDRDEIGQAVCVFSARTKLADTALLRVQTVDISTKQLTGIRVPRQALRVFTEEITDEDTGAVAESTYTGVFTVVGSQAEIQRVDVLYTADDYYLVEPVNPAAARRLRPGDEIIVNSTGVYDGKVVR